MRRLVVVLVVCVASQMWADDWKWDPPDGWTVTDTLIQGEHGNLNAVGMKPLTDLLITGDVKIARFHDHTSEPRVGIRFRNRKLPTGQSEDYYFSFRPNKVLLQRLTYGGGLGSKWPTLARKDRAIPLNVWIPFRISVVRDVIAVELGPPLQIRLQAQDPNPIPEGVVAIQFIKASTSIRNLKIAALGASGSAATAPAKVPPSTTRRRKGDPKCRTCKGKGRARCATCRALGYVKQQCPTCQGQKKRCTNCKKGYLPCEKCKPIGKKPRGAILCPTCRGTRGTNVAQPFGRSFFDDCDICNGKGYVACPDCKGRARIDCEKCKKGWVICATCQGKKHIKPVCTACKGVKYVDCPDCMKQ